MFLPLGGKGSLLRIFLPRSNRWRDCEGVVMKTSNALECVMRVLVGYCLGLGLIVGIGFLWSHFA